MLYIRLRMEMFLFNYFIQTEKASKKVTKKDKMKEKGKREKKLLFLC